MARKYIPTCASLRPGQLNKVNANIQDYNPSDMIEWLNLLLDYAEGKKEWDTGGAWVCERHHRLPWEMGYLFDCKCGAPGMPAHAPHPPIPR